MSLQSQLIGVWNLDPRGMVVRIDPGIAKLYAIDPAMGEKGIPLALLIDRVHPDDQEELAAKRSSALANRDGFHAAFRVKSAEGWRRVMAEGRYIEDDGLARLSGIILDAGTDGLDNTARRVGPRELECLSWCSRGKTNWEIGQILGISERTVEHHIAAVIRKLGCMTRAHATATAVRTGLIV